MKGRTASFLLASVACTLALLSRSRPHSPIVALEHARAVPSQRHGRGELPGSLAFAGDQGPWSSSQLEAARAKILQEREDRVAEFEKQRNAGWETLNALKARSAGLMVDEGYYKHQAHLAKSEEEFYRRRAEKEDDAAWKAEKNAYAARKAAWTAQDEEEEELAAKNAIAVKNAELDDRLQQQYLTADKDAREQAQQLESIAARAYAVGLSPQGNDKLRRMHLADWAGGSPNWAGGSPKWAESYTPEEPGDAWGATMRVAGDGGSIPRWLRHGLKPETGQGGHDLLGGRWSSWNSKPTFIPNRLQSSDKRR